MVGGRGGGIFLETINSTSVRLHMIDSTGGTHQDLFVQATFNDWLCFKVAAVLNI